MTLLPSAATFAAAPVSAGLAEQAAREGRARVIVRLDAPVAVGGGIARAQARASIAAAAEAALARIGGPARPDLRRYQTLPLVALEASPRELVELGASPEVLGIQADRPNWPSLTESIPRVGGDVTANAGWDGMGAVVVIADTGVESSHPFFEGRVVAQACFSFGRDCPNGQKTQYGAPAGEPCTYGSLCWHGTHVAGIAAGENATMHGVAPGASIISIQTGSRTTVGCGSAGSPCVTIYDSDAIAALDYVGDVLAGSWNVAAVNMSFASSTVWDDESACDQDNSPMKVAIDALRSLEIASVAASGNASASNGISSPACISSAIGVGATADNADFVASISNTGVPLDLFAPGAFILSSKLGASYQNATGTSMATPHVAGAFAVLRQADPAASVSTLESALVSTGVPVTDPDNGLTRPRIQVDDAVRVLGPAQCFDGLDNDGDGSVDVDGNGGSADPNCVDGFDDSEAPDPTPGCGIGPELALLVPLLATLARRRNRSAA